jgi:hypothetical protein
MTSLDLNDLEATAWMVCSASAASPAALATTAPIPFGDPVLDIVGPEAWRTCREPQPWPTHDLSEIGDSQSFRALRHRQPPDDTMKADVGYKTEDAWTADGGHPIRTRGVSSIRLNLLSNHKNSREVMRETPGGRSLAARSPLRFGRRLTPLVRRVPALSLSVVLETARAHVHYSDTSEGGSEGAW